jgi:hypothetical protein
MFEMTFKNFDGNSFYSPRYTGNDHASLLNRAINLFNWSRWNATLERVKAAILYRSSVLFDLESLSGLRVRASHYGGIQAVSLEHICGTLGRTSDFDNCFHPLDDRLRDRWVSIAIARFQYIPLAPVELIHVGGCYFVKDGHHRISVARAFGESAVDAEVTIWDVSGRLPWETAPASATVQIAFQER